MHESLLVPFGTEVPSAVEHRAAQVHNPGTNVTRVGSGRDTKKQAGGRSALCSILVILLVFRLRDGFSDCAWKGDAGHRKFRLVAGGVNLDCPDPKKPVQEPLRHIH